jgi:molybdate-binding protein
VLLLQLLDEQRLSLDDLTVVHPVVYTETELGLAISEGWADAGLAIEAAARRFKLDFVPLHEERFDLAVRRRSYFEPPVQALLRHARSRAFAREAAALGGYDISQLGRIVWNGK